MCNILDHKELISIMTRQSYTGVGHVIDKYELNKGVNKQNLRKRKS